LVWFIQDFPDGRVENQFWLGKENDRVIALYEAIEPEFRSLFLLAEIWNSPFSKNPCFNRVLMLSSGKFLTEICGTARLTLN
jgi:hypothetical protein